MGGRAKGRNGELIGLPRWQLGLTGSGSMYNAKDLTCMITGFIVPTTPQSFFEKHAGV